MPADQYLTKPFDLDEFLSRVKNLLTFHSRRELRQRRQAGKIVSFEFADARMNFETFEAAVHDEPVRLTQLEMTLLRYFIENEGRVIPRRELLENVWGMPGTLNPRAPDQFIRRLRELRARSGPAPPFSYHPRRRLPVCVPTWRRKRKTTTSPVSSGEG